MKNYLSLIYKYNRFHRKERNMISLCIIISVCLINTIFSLADIGIKYEILQTKYDYGDYHINIKNISNNDSEIIRNHFDVKESGWVFSTENIDLDNKNVNIIGGEQDILEFLGLEIIEGCFPNTDNEILINKSAASINNLNINEQINLSLNNNEKSYKISGIFNDEISLLTKDTMGIVFSCSGIQNLPLDSNGRFYITFQDNININKAIKNIQQILNIDQSTISKNNYLLTVMGQGDNNFAIKLYIIAAVLFSLVLVTGCIMINNSININIRRRINFFGMMRCLGATKKQLSRYVIFECLDLGKITIPLGLLLSTLITQFAVYMLRHLNPSIFSNMAFFNFSWIGLIFGILIGISALIISSLYPAKLAASTSPLNALRKGNINSLSFKKVYVNKLSKKLPIEISLAIFNIFSNFKQLLLIVISLSISIVMLFGFSVFTNFIYEMAQPFKIEAPDISIYEESFDLLIPEQVKNELTNNDSIKDVYARKMISSNVTDKNEISDCILLSYEDIQFNWSRDDLVLGSINLTNLKHNNYILTDLESGLSIGDEVTLHTSIGDYKVIVGGILSNIPYKSERQNVKNFILSDTFFTSITNINDYSIIDIHINENISETDILNIRKSIPKQFLFVDMRESNKNGENSFYTMAIFIYGFTFIIAIISILNIVNTININFNRREKQYKIIMCLGATKKQIAKVIKFESCIYITLSMLVGMIFGIITHRILYQILVYNYFHKIWAIPSNIILFVIISNIILVFISPISSVNRLKEIKITNL